MSNPDENLIDARQKRAEVEELASQPFPMTPAEAHALAEAAAALAGRFDALDRDLSAGARMPGDWERICVRLPSRAGLAAVLADHGLLIPGLSYEQTAARLLGVLAAGGDPAVRIDEPAADHDRLAGSPAFSAWGDQA